jgi:hypothetical protein
LTKTTTLSDFLLVLVKDLEYFSQYQFKQYLVLEENEVELKKLLEFVKNIAEILIHKNNNTISVKFDIKTEGSLPIIILVDVGRI